MPDWRALLGFKVPAKAPALAQFCARAVGISAQRVSIFE
jgi:hypothetical protein